MAGLTALERGTVKITLSAARPLAIRAPPIRRAKRHIHRFAHDFWSVMARRSRTVARVGADRASRDEWSSEVDAVALLVTSARKQYAGSYPCPLANTA